MQLNTPSQWVTKIFAAEGRQFQQNQQVFFELCSAMATKTI